MSYYFFRSVAETWNPDLRPWHNFCILVISITERESYKEARAIDWKSIIPRFDADKNCEFVPLVRGFRHCCRFYNYFVAWEFLNSAFSYFYWECNETSTQKCVSCGLAVLQVVDMFRIWLRLYWRGDRNWIEFWEGRNGPIEVVLGDVLENV